MTSTDSVCAVDSFPQLAGKMSLTPPSATSTIDGAATASLTRMGDECGSGMPELFCLKIASGGEDSARPSFRVCNEGERLSGDFAK